MNLLRLQKDGQQSVSLSPDSFREVFARRVLFVLFLALLFLGHLWTNQAQNRPAKWLEEDFLKIHMELNVPNRVGRTLGERFDKDVFKQAIKASRVQVVTLFAKDAYGNAFFRTRHGYFDPGLKFDLVKQQVDALHELGIRVLTHYSVGDDSHIDLYHPDWLCQDMNHKPLSGGPLSNRACLNSPYREEQLLPQLEEIAQLGVDGLWLDIWARPDGCFCQHCRRKFQERYHAELTPVESRRFQFWRESWEEALAAVNLRVRATNKDIAITWNGADILSQARQGMVNFFTNESHLNAVTGYEDHQIKARYYRALGVPFDIQNMTNVERWDDSTLKSVEMLKLEFSQTLAHGGRISAGTQLYPWGEYERVGAEVLGDAFKFIEERLPYLQGARTVPFAVVLCPDSAPGEGLYKMTSDRGLVGTLSALAQLHLQFDLLEASNGGYELLPRYQLAIIPHPEATFQTSEGRTVLKQFLKGGGKLLLISNGRAVSGQFLDELGLKLRSTSLGKSRGTLRGADRNFDFPFQEELNILAGDQTRNLVTFETSHEKFPVVCLLNQQISYVAWPLGRAYYESGYSEWLGYLDTALSSLKLTNPYEIQGHSNLDSNLMQRQDEYLLHLVYAPIQKGMPGLMPQVWKLAPIHDVELTVRCPRPGKVLLEPQGRELEFTHDGSAVHVKVPEVHIYEIVRIIAAK